MFGIMADVFKETVKTAKTADKTATNIYKEVKDTADECGLGPKSAREVIKEFDPKR